MKRLHRPTLLQFTTAFVPALVWMMLWGQYDLATFLSGLIFGTVLAIVFPLPRLQLVGTFRPHWFVVFVAMTLWDLCRASAQILVLCLKPRLELHNSVIEIPLHSRTDLVMTHTVLLINLVPGTVVVEASPSTRVLHLHVLNAGDDQSRVRAYRRALENERRVARVFAPREEYLKVPEWKAFAEKTTYLDWGSR